MSENSAIIVRILVLIVSALLMTWALAVWLPGRAFTRGAKLRLAALLSLVGFQFARVGVMATIPTFNGSFLTDILQYISEHGDLTYWAFYWAGPLLFSVPVMAGAATLLYFGGRAVRFRRSGAAVIKARVGVVLGFLLWIGAVLCDVLLVEIVWRN
jgi:hypothetical protein